LEPNDGHPPHLITNNRTLMMGSNYFQELILYLHLFDVYSMPILSRSTDHTNRGRVWEGLSTWGDIPAVVCITLRVRELDSEYSRASLDETRLAHRSLYITASFDICWWIFTEYIRGGTISFGKITTSGPRTVLIQNTCRRGQNRLDGKLPLIVSFYAPTGWFCSNHKMRT